MGTFNARDLQQLRQRTGAGMMDCKKALEESDGLIEQAIEYLRKKGMAKADKRAGRTASEGLIGSYIHHNGRLGVLVEVNCETDFVARTDDFRELARYLAEHVAATTPLAVDRDGVSAEKVEVERRIAEGQTRASGKPEAMIQKIVEGKIEAFFKDVTLLSQPWEIGRA